MFKKVSLLAVLSSMLCFNIANAQEEDESTLSAETLNGIKKSYHMIYCYGSDELKKAVLNNIFIKSLLDIGYISSVIKEAELMPCDASIVISKEGSEVYDVFESGTAGMYPVADATKIYLDKDIINKVVEDESKGILHLYNFGVLDEFLSRSIYDVKVVIMAVNDTSIENFMLLGYKKSGEPKYGIFYSKIPMSDQVPIAFVPDNSEKINFLQVNKSEPKFKTNSYEYSNSDSTITKFFKYTMLNHIPMSKVNKKPNGINGGVVLFSTVSFNNDLVNKGDYYFSTFSWKENKLIERLLEYQTKK